MKMLGMRRFSRRLSAGMLAVALTLSIGSGTNPQLAEAQEKCSDHTTDNRPCTSTEELGFCLTNAIESYGECTDGAGWLMKLGCLVAYEIDFYACYPSSLITSMVNAIGSTL
jgi:hypothetical protein